MDSFSLKIQVLEQELSGFARKLEEDKEKSKKLELEINQVEMMKASTNCIINNEIRIVQELRTRLKKIHEAYQDLSTQSTSQYYQYLIMNRLEELYQERETFESQLGHLKLKRGIEEEKLEEIKMKVMTQNNKKRAMLLKLQKNCEKSEAARNEAFEKLKEVKNKRQDPQLKI